MEATMQGLGLSKSRATFLGVHIVRVNNLLGVYTGAQLRMYGIFKQACIKSRRQNLAPCFGPRAASRRVHLSLLSTLRVRAYGLWLEFSRLKKLEV